MSKAQGKFDFSVHHPFIVTFMNFGHMPLSKEMAEDMAAVTSSRIFLSNMIYPVLCKIAF